MNLGDRERYLRKNGVSLAKIDDFFKANIEFSKNKKEEKRQRYLEKKEKFLRYKEEGAYFPGRPKFRGGPRFAGDSKFSRGGRDVSPRDRRYSRERYDSRDRFDRETRRDFRRNFSRSPVRRSPVSYNKRFSRSPSPKYRSDLDAKIKHERYSRSNSPVLEKILEKSLKKCKKIVSLWGALTLFRLFSFFIKTKTAGFLFWQQSWILQKIQISISVQIFFTRIQSCVRKTSKITKSQTLTIPQTSRPLHLSISFTCLRQSKKKSILQPSQP